MPAQYGFFNRPDFSNFRFNVQPEKTVKPFHAGTNITSSVPAYDRRADPLSRIPGSSGIPGIGDFSRIIDRFPSDQQPFVEAGLAGLGGTIGYNEKQVSAALADLLKGEQNITGLFDNIEADFAKSLPINPYTDELRQKTLTNIEDQLTREQIAAINKTQQAYGARGLGYSSAAVGAESDILGDVIQARTAANVETLATQVATNNAANLGRGQIFSALGSAEGQLLNQLKLGGANLQAGLAIDPNTVPDFIGNLLSTYLGQQNFETAIDTAESIEDRNRPNWLEDFLQGLTGAYPGNQTLRLGGIAGTLFGNASRGLY